MFVLNNRTRRTSSSNIVLINSSNFVVPTVTKTFLISIFGELNRKQSNKHFCKKYTIQNIELSGYVCFQFTWGRCSAK